MKKLNPSYVLRKRIMKFIQFGIMRMLADHVYDGTSALFSATNQERPYEQLLYNWKKWPSSDFPLF